MSPVSLPANRLLVAALSLLLTRLSCSSLSVPDIPHIAAYFGTKTRYEEVNPHLLRDVFSVNASVLKPPPTERCSPVHLTAVIRHGSRYPTVKNIRRIQKLSELVRREASRGSAEGWLQDIQSRWEMWYTEDMDGERPLKYPPKHSRYTATYFHTLLLSLRVFQVSVTSYNIPTKLLKYHRKYPVTSL